MMLRKPRFARALLLSASALLALGKPSSARAAIYVTGSVSTSTTNVPLEKSSMQYGSAAVDIDIGRYLRFGVNYGNEVSTTAGYQLANAQATTSSGSTENVTCPTTTSCVPVLNKTTIVERGAGFTLLLWAGDIFMPYVMVGGVMKNYIFETQTNGGAIDKRKGATPPVPNLGAGLGIRLNKDFMLKLSYQASPGVMQVPGGVAKPLWDRKATVGLTYQIN